MLGTQTQCSQTPLIVVNCEWRPKRSIFQKSAIDSMTVNISLTSHKHNSIRFNSIWPGVKIIFRTGDASSHTHTHTHKNRKFTSFPFLGQPLDFRAYFPAQRAWWLARFHHSFFDTYWWHSARSVVHPLYLFFAIFNTENIDFLYVCIVMPLGSKWNK